jgi:hypothetical protein
MTPDRNKHGVAFWATVVVVAALLYPISFGPACWITSRSGTRGNCPAVAPFVVLFLTIAFPDIALPAILAVVAVVVVLVIVRIVGRLTDPQRDRHLPRDPP